MRFPLASALLLCATPALADDPALFVSGPDACAVVAGAGGLDAATEALGPENNILDHAMIRGGAEECVFDTEITLDPEGGPEHAEGLCRQPDGSEARGGFDIVYSGAGMTVVIFPDWPEPRVFRACPFM